MEIAAWLVLGLLCGAVVSAVLHGRDPEVRRRYDRWGVGHGSYSGRTAGWFGGDRDQDRGPG